jgi:hypothetical protein
MQLLALRATSGSSAAATLSSRLVRPFLDSRTLSSPEPGAATGGRGNLLRRLVMASTIRIKAEKARGMVHDLDPGAVARALVLMTERVLLDRLGGPRAGRPEAVVEPLLQVWMRTLYLRDATP